MKTCTNCGTARPLDDFPRRASARDGRAPWCKPCKNELDRRYYHDSPERKARVRARHIAATAAWKQRLLDYLLEHPCVDCGEGDPIVLEFDHLPGSEKVSAVALMWNRSWANTLAEIAKCEVVCANCHRRRTSRRAGWFKSLAMSPSGGI